MNHKILIVLTLQITSIWMLPVHPDLQDASLTKQQQQTSMMTSEESQKEPRQLSMSIPMQADLQRLLRPPMTTQKQVTSMSSEESQQESRQLSMTFPMQSYLQRLKRSSMMTQQQQTSIMSKETPEEARQLPMTSQLQQQLMALQQLQVMQKLNTVHAPSTLYLPQPFMILLPNPPLQDDEESNTIKETDGNADELNHKNSNKEYVDEALDSVIIDAETTDEERVPQRAVLLVPSSRISIGEIISGIPWLPFEVNVPDTIAWAWNGISSGISGIISIIGQRLPFRPRPQMSMMTKTQGANVKMFLKQLQMKQSMMPIFVLPFQRPVIPMQML